MTPYPYNLERAHGHARLFEAWERMTYGGFRPLDPPPADVHEHGEHLWDHRIHVAKVSEAAVVIR